MTPPSFFPTSHSVLSADALADFLAQRYRFEGRPRVQLLYRGMNDIYIVHDEARRYALRAWRHGFRTNDEVGYELGFLAFLTGNGFPAAASIPAIDGTPYYVADAPEGPRQIALYVWAPGGKFGGKPDPAIAELMGTWFARMHLMACDFQPAFRRQTNPPAAFLRNVPPLLELVFDRPDDIAFYPKLAEALTRRVAEVANADLPRGPTHGDFHFNNAHVDENGNLLFLDFDNAGEDFWLQDVACYVWANNYGGYDQAYADRFLKGYWSVRPFTKDETELMPLYLLVKEFRLLSGMARNVNAIGHAPLRFRSLDWFAHSLRTQAAELKLV